MKLRIIWTLLFLFIAPTLSSAEIPAQVSKDFSQISGYVVMSIGEEFLIDLDATKGVAEGDVFAVVQKGEKVIHPVTREVIGALDEIKGFLQVTRVKSGYSYAKLLSPAQTSVGKGDQISRFYQVPTRFLAETAEQQSILGELKKTLPLLDWLPVNSDVVPLLTFQQLTGRLVVETTPDTLLFSYPLLPQAPAGVKEQSKAIVSVPIVPVPGVPTGIVPSVAVVEEQTSNIGDVWNSPVFNEAAVGMTVGDFDGDGHQEIALALGKTLRIVRNFQGQFTEVASLPIATGLTPLAVDSVDLDGNGTSEILLTIIKKSSMTIASQLIEFEQGQYRSAIVGIPWFMRVIDVPGEGPVLLGQRMLDKQEPFAESLFRVRRDENQLIQDQFFPLPQHVGIYGFTPFTDGKGQLLYAYLSNTDYLKVVTSAGEILWDSADYFGGSEIRFEKALEARNDDPILAYVKARILIAGDSLLLPQNDGMRLLQGYRKFQKSRMVAVKWNGLTMENLWKTADQGGYLNDIALADMDNDGQVELLTFVKFKHKGLFQKARSALVAYELN